MAQTVQSKLGQSSPGGGVGLPLLGGAAGGIPGFLAGLFATLFGQQGQQRNQVGTSTSGRPIFQSQTQTQTPTQADPRRPEGTQVGTPFQVSTPALPPPFTPAPFTPPTPGAGGKPEPTGFITYTPVGVPGVTQSTTADSTIGRAMTAVQQTIADLFGEDGAGVSPGALERLGNLSEFFGIPAEANISIANTEVVRMWQQATADALGDPVVGEQIFRARLRQFLAGDEVPLGGTEPTPFAEDPFLAELIAAFDAFNLGGGGGAAPGAPAEEGQDAAFFLDPAFSRGTETFDFFPGA